MSENYFANLRTIGANLDKGITKLQETWKMPHLLLCKSNEEDEIKAKKLIENLKNELTILKETLEDKKIAVTYLREIHAQFLKESIEAVRILKEEVDDTKILFAENGYVEEPVEYNLSILNSQVKSLSVNNSESLIKNSDNVIESTTYENNDSINTAIPKNNISFNSLKNMSLNQQPIKPVYSPYYYKTIKK